MTDVIVIKILLLFLFWSFGWCIYFANIRAEANAKTLSIVGAPWIGILVYIMLFWW